MTTEQGAPEAGAWKEPGLSPCPFCGHAPYLKGYHAPEFWVACQTVGCRASTEAFGSKEKAIAAWNRRAASPSPPPVGVYWRDTALSNARSAGAWEDAHRELLKAVMACCDPELKVCGLHPGPERLELEAVIERQHTYHGVNGPFVPAPPVGGEVVKLLRWPLECRRGERVYATGIGLRYCIAHYGGDVGGAIYRWAPPTAGWSEPFETYDAAKDAVQADFELRIRSALVPSSPSLLKKRPSAFIIRYPSRYPDLVLDETLAARIADENNVDYHGLYERDGTPFNFAPSLLEEVGEALRSVNRRASPSPERTFDVAIRDLEWIADEARRIIAKLGVSS